MGAAATDRATARELRAGLPADRRDRSTALGLGLFFVNAAAYVATFAAVVLAADWGVKAGAAVLNGVSMGTLFILGHDAGHNTLTARGWLNRLLGRAALLPVLQPFSAWVLSHNGRHHGWTNLAGMDHVLPPLSKGQYDALPGWRRRLERVYRSPPGLALFYFVEVYWKHELFPKAAARPRHRLRFELDRALVFAYLLAETALAAGVGHHRTGSVPGAVAVWVLAVPVPFAVWKSLRAFVTYQQHTHPRVPWFDRPAEWTFVRGQVWGSPHVVLPGWIGWPFHNVMNHTAHHVDPQIPLYHLPPAQGHLDGLPGGPVVVVRWTWRDYFHTLRCCKLYDYRAHRWMGFDGTYTTGPLLAGPPSPLPAVSS